MKKKTRGMFITFEGVEGSGKSTHSELLYKHLKRLGYNCVHTREPGGTKVGEQVRRVLLDVRNSALTPLCELFLFESARAQIVQEVIVPNLDKGRIVICDRFFDATIAYQGFGAGLDLDMIEKLNTSATGGLAPDLTVYMDLDEKTGLRRSRRLDRMEKKSMAFHKRVRKGYLYLARKKSGRIKLISVERRMEDTQKKVRDAVLNAISGCKRPG
ncbi:MAG: dTMP kinase [Candidatus Omnitrophota bacterium]